MIRLASSYHGVDHLLSGLILPTRRLCKIDTSVLPHCLAGNINSSVRVSRRALRTDYLWKDGLLQSVYKRIISKYDPLETFNSLTVLVYYHFVGIINNFDVKTHRIKHHSHGILLNLLRLLLVCGFGTRPLSYIQSYTTRLGEIFSLCTLLQTAISHLIFWLIHSPLIKLLRWFHVLRLLICLSPTGHLTRVLSLLFSIWRGLSLDQSAVTMNSVIFDIFLTTQPDTSQCLKDYIRVRWCNTC